MHPADIAKAIHDASDNAEKQRLFEAIEDSSTQAHVLSELSSEHALQILEGMPIIKLSTLIEKLPRDDATDILGSLPQETVLPILRSMAREDAAQLKCLLTYPKRSAGGIMTTQYVAVPQQATVNTTFEAIRKSASDEMISEIYVTDDYDKLVGVVALRTLLRVSLKARIEDIMDRDPIFVTPETNQETVATKVSRYNLLSIPVVHPNKKLAGIITIDDVVDVIQEETTEDMLRMSGISTAAQDDPQFYASGLQEAKRRLPWIFVNMLGSIIAGYILWFFRYTIQEVVAIISFIPIITALGGNAGLQSSTLIIRSLAIGKIDQRDLRKLCIRESWVALLMGSICGGLIFVVTLVWHANAMLGLVVGLSMTLTFLLAVITATTLPILLKYNGLDPAIAAAPLITTATDIASITVYLMLATLLLTSLT
tara:strand:- start:8170 stop:9447 length:1278 start_codon:yes stop_codon:yes gene_type:complete